MNCKVSIIVPIYKVEDYLDKCIQSIVSQTHTNLEILLIDDGSPDKCPQICDSWYKKDSRIHVIHKENGGVSKARNLGMELASGDYIMFVDSDDYLPQKAVELLLHRLLSDGSDMSIGKNIHIYSDGRKDTRYSDFIKDTVLSGDAFLRAMGNINHYDVGPCAKLYTRKVLQGISFPAMSCGEDMWVFPDIVLKCSKISVLNEFVYYYFQRHNSVTHTRSDRYSLESVRATQRMTKIYLEKNWNDCAGCWFGFGVQYIQEMQDKSLGVALMEELFTKEQIKDLLREVSFAIHAKWFLVQHTRLYSIVFGLKRILLPNKDIGCFLVIFL